MSASPDLATVPGFRAALWHIRELQAGNGMIGHPVRVFRDNLQVMEAARADVAWVAELLARAIEGRGGSDDARRARLQRQAKAAEADLARRRASDCVCRHYYRTRSLAPWFIDREIRRHMAAEMADEAERA